MYYPRSLGVNFIYDRTANLQDGTEQYDLNFGRTFYDFSRFDGFDQAKTLSQVRCPVLFLHVAASTLTAPNYYDDNGVLLAALDEKDAARVVEILPHGKLIDGFESIHDIHADFPKEFANELIRFEETLVG